MMHLWASCCALSSVGLPVSGRAWRATTASRGARSCWRGTLLWKQQWRSLCGGERSPPGTERGTELTLAFQLASRGFFFFSINPPIPLSPLAFTPTLFASLPFQLHFPPRVLNFFSNSPTSLFVFCFFSPSTLLSVSAFSFCATKTAIEPRWTKTLRRNATTVWVSAPRFSPELLCVSRSLRGHCFPSPVCGRGLDVGVEGSRWPRARLEKNREWGRSAKKVWRGIFTGVVKCSSGYNMHSHTYLKFMALLGPLEGSFFWFLHLEMREDGRSSLARWVAVSFIRWPDAGLQKTLMLLWSFSTKTPTWGKLGLSCQNLQLLRFRLFSFFAAALLFH